MMDAMTLEVQRKGGAFMAPWAKFMTCMQPKTNVLRCVVGLHRGRRCARNSSTFADGVLQTTGHIAWGMQRSSSWVLHVGAPVL